MQKKSNRKRVIMFNKDSNEKRVEVHKDKNDKNKDTSSQLSATNKKDQNNQNSQNDQNSQNNQLKNSEDIENDFYYALSHEIRRKIIKMIGDNKEGSFTQFKKTFKISTGTLYHHLDVLKSLITQNSKRKYILTNLGKHAYNFLINNYDSIESNQINESRLANSSLNIFLYIVPRKMLNILAAKPLYAWLSSIFLLLAMCLLIINAGINNSFIFFLPLDNSPQNIPLTIKIWQGIKFIISVFITIVASDLLCSYLFQKKENSSQYYSLFSIGLYPMLIYLILYNIFYYLLPNLIDSLLNKIIMVLFQFITLWLLSYILVSYKYIKIEKALVIMFLIHYISLNILLFLYI
ncbi:MAG: winged helix-turn-helix domain-containing protein [Promethearchaeota archaeon]